ncbi:nucleoside hydrolase [Luteolibacter luteus]|uniref:Nucleoside hydrolase n=2 Tax=Luteolibacter luteus TaxID=2728835 RepID=A0A858RSZ3_9BACT|nr:nucleoside hydrolase [Luteolibacter luteus]
MALSGHALAELVARMRVVVDNDFGEDPDGLFQLAHLLLSPSVEVPGIVASHHYKGGFYGYPGSTEHSCKAAKELLEVMKLSEKIPLYAGASESLETADAPMESEGARFIVREAMREDVKTPLYIVCGAGLTNLASAWLMKPEIAEKVTVIWIGGAEHEGIALPPPKASKVEYNLGIDLKAGQVVFNRSRLAMWQVPRDAYRQALVSHAELRQRMRGKGKLGAYLLGRLDDLMERSKHSLGEAYVLGDSPLVLLTALQSGWEPAPSSSSNGFMPTPRINDAGKYEMNPAGAGMRIYTGLDTRLMFEDFYAKVAKFDNEE